MSDRLVADSIFPEIRFLLAQYKSCSAILDKYPDNFAFEIVSRLASFIDVLPQFIYDLFQQCLRNSRLCMLKSDARISSTIMNKYYIGAVNGICLGYSTLYVFVPEKLLIFRHYAQDWIGKIFEYKLPSNEFTSVKFSSIDICFYSSKSILVFQKFDHRFGLHLNFDHIIHVDFIYKEGLFVCSRGNQSIDIWHCLDKTLLDQYVFDVPILECSTIERHMGTTVRVTLETGFTHYLITANIQGKIRFQLVAILKEKPAKHNIFLNFETDVYYTENQSHIYLYHFEHDRLEKIDHLPLLNRVISRQSFFTDRHHSALIWLTIDSVVIFHSCGNYFLIPGIYHDIYKRCQFKRNFICCLNRDDSRIDIYEWKLNERVHTYRRLAHLELDEKVLHWTCHIGECLPCL
jgi:hypothetical protein